MWVKNHNNNNNMAFIQHGIDQGILEENEEKAIRLIRYLKTIELYHEI
jgi:hypothetical protein